MDERPAGGGLVVPGARVRMSGEPVRVGPPVAPGAGGPEPNVQTFQQDGVVRIIQVVCTCGERICIRCEY